MSRFWTHTLITVGLASLVACTDGRPTTELQVGPLTSRVGTTLVATGDIQFKKNGEIVSTNAYQINITGGSIFMTGTPMGFSRSEISQDMEEPVFTFSSGTQLDTFNPMGAWTPDWFGSGAIAIYGQTAFLSGSLGTSVVTMQNTVRPVEVQRYPAPDQKSSVPTADPNFSYTAMTFHPTQKILYAFTRQDNMFTYDLSQGRLAQVAKEAYGSPGQTVCCVLGAATFNNQVYVAFRDRLVVYDILSNGRLQKRAQSTILNPSNVVATARYLYVQHQPTSSSGANGARVYPQGIYVFDKTGRSVSFFAAGNPKKFAVSSDDSHLYSNVDGNSVKIYRIQWTN